MIHAKEILIQKPDITGENKQEFACYGVLLAHASPVLDAMPSSGMTESVHRRIEIQTKDPDVWKLFFKCIAPSRVALCWRTLNYKNLRVSNVKMLVPLFHELGMDGWIFDEMRFYSQIWDCSLGRSFANSTQNVRSIEKLSVATKYHLQETQEQAAPKIATLLERFYWGRHI